MEQNHESASRHPAGTSWRGLSIAIAIQILWASVVAFAWLEFDWAKQSIMSSVGLVFLLVFLFTGLFITAHEAMHGLVAPSHSGLNRAIGRISLFLFAGFSFDSFLPKHHLHHAETATERDPDFHDGKNPGAIRWFATFMRRHTDWRPFAFYAALFLVAQLWVGRPMEFLLAWPLPALVSSFQLFYFGTYLPHRKPSEGYNSLRSRSNDYPTWLSFLTCYHFGYHYEHHLHPSVPWWALPRVRKQIRIQFGGQKRKQLRPEGEVR